MTTRRRLLPDSEIRRTLELLREHGIELGGVDIRADGITVFTKAAEVKGNAFDAWKKQNSDRSAPR